MSFLVRLAAADELPAVGDLTVAAYRDDGFVAADDDYLAELADAAGRARDAEVWVAVEGASVLGSVTFCGAGSPYAELAAEGQGEFRMLGVAAGARRRGVARALVQRCLDRCRELGYDEIVLSSMREMRAAHRLYEKLGFRRAPERDWSPHPGVDLIAFTRPVG